MDERNQALLRTPQPLLVVQSYWKDLAKDYLPTYPAFKVYYPEKESLALLPIGLQLKKCCKAAKI